MTIDLSKTIEAKSDQLNADDLLGIHKILKITAIKAGSADQPIIINFEGDQGKPYKPSKGMRRVLVSAWGPDGGSYVGRSIEVYNEPTVTWAGQAVGGIRISRMSDIKNTIVVPLALTRGKKVPLKISPLEIKEMSIEERQAKTLELLEKKGVTITSETKEIVESASTPEELKDIFTTLTNKE